MAARGHGAARRWAAVGALVAVARRAPPVIGALPASDAAVPAADLRAAALASEDARVLRLRRVGRRARAAGHRPAHARSPTCSATAPRCGSGGAAPPTTGSTSSPPAGETGTHRERARHLDLGVRARDGHPRGRHPARAARAAGPAAHLARPPAAVRGHRRRAVPDRRPPGRRPRRPRAAAGPGRGGVVGAAGSTSGWTPRQRPAAAGRGRTRRARGRPALDTRFLDLEVGRPPADVTAFTPPRRRALRRGARGRGRAGGRTADRPGRRCPAELAGLPRRQLEGVPPGIGLYGRGVTLLAVAPVPARPGPGAAQRPGRRPRRGPRRRWAPGWPPGRSALMLVEPPGRGPYVLTGTVTLDALATAAAQLPGRCVVTARDHAPAGWSSGSAGCARSTASTSTCAPATSTGSSAPTARARRRRSGCCSGWCCPPAGRSSCSASGCRGPGGGCCRASARWSRGRPTTATCPAGRTWRCSTPPAAGGSWRTRRAADRRRPRPGRARRGRPPPGQGLLARHAAAARPGRRAAAPSGAARARRADQRPGPAGHHRGPRAAARPAPHRDDGLPVQPPAGRGRAAVLAGRRARPRPAGAAGRAGHADRADRVDGRAHADARPGARDARRPGHRGRRRARRRPRRRPGRGQRAARRRRDRR